MAAKRAQEHIVRVPCSVEGFEECWIDFDVSGWGLYEFREMHESTLNQAIEQYVEADSVDWNLTGDNGPVPHPGRGADADAWRSAYKQVGPGASKALWRWLGVSSVMAINLMTEPGKKSAAGREGGGQG